MRFLAVGCAFVATLFLSSSSEAARKWVIRGSYSSAHFEAKHLLVSSVRGSFAKVRGSAVIDDDDLTQSFVSATVAVASLYSGSGARDAWLLSKDWLAAAQHPFASFVSTSVARSPQGQLLMTGKLTIRGVTQEVVFELTDPTPPQRDLDGQEVRAIKARAVIDRKRYGMVWQESVPGGGVVVGDEINLELDIELLATAS